MWRPVWQAAKESPKILEERNNFTLKFLKRIIKDAEHCLALVIFLLFIIIISMSCFVEVLEDAFSAKVEGTFDFDIWLS